MPTPRLSRKKHALVHHLAGKGLSNRKVAAKAGVSVGTVSNYTKEPLPDLNVSAELPESWAEEYPPFMLPGPCRALLLPDVHVPFHDRAAIECAVREGKAAGCNVVIFTGDTFDCHSVSKYPHDGTAITYQQEVAYGQQFMRYVRGQFPKARLIFKEGNHEERLEKYVLGKAPALFGIEECTLSSLFGLGMVGAEVVKDQRVIRLGKLRVIHGHELGSVSAPVNAARWLVLKAKRNAIMGHLHHTSEQPSRDIDGDEQGAWSMGCLCGLSPKYRKLALSWNHGAAIVDVSKDGSFGMRNFRIKEGKVL